VFLDYCDTAIATAANRLDHPLRAAAIPNSPTRCGHEPLESIIADKLLGPQGVEEFLARDHPVTVLDEIGKELEDFGLELQEYTHTVELIPLCIQGIVAKRIPHRERLRLSILCRTGRILAERCTSVESESSALVHHTSANHVLASNAGLLIVQGLEKKETFHYLPKKGSTTRDVLDSNRRTSHAYDHTGGAG
jgi:hypothetical protein